MVTLKRPSFRDAALGLGIAFFAVVEAVRVVHAPIRGTAGWDLGLLAGVLIGAAGAVAWWIVGRRKNDVAKFGSIVAMIALGGVLLLTSGTPDVAFPPLESWYVTAAVAYAAVGLAGAAVLMVT